MKYKIRVMCDKFFTALTTASVVLMILVLIAVLGPMITKGGRAVFFVSTVEFRKMQFDLYNRGDKEEIAKQIEKSKVHRDFIYTKIDTFKRGINVDAFAHRAKEIYRQFGKELQYNNIKGQELSNRREIAKKIRQDLEKAFTSVNKAEIMQILDSLEQYKSNEYIANTAAVEFFQLAQDYKDVIKDFDLTKRQQYAQSLGEVEKLVKELFGPRPEQALPSLIMDRFGATRYDQANAILKKLIWDQSWVQQGGGQPMVQKSVRRSDEFAGTVFESIFPYIEENFEKIVEPRSTFYWQFFIDDSVAGHYFGGVGPEILGTLVLTLLAMAFVFPLGVISAAYLVECASDSLVIRIIRMCINTLAGVPSIVFGLFGMAFFVLFLFPALGLPSKPCILAASLTLAVLALPVMIRASEEAIRAVPHTYKEASLGLGAGGFRTFVKVTLPAAMPGILTGVILSLSRVAGETAPVLFTGAVAFGSIPRSLFSPTRTLSYGSYDIAVGDKIGMLVPHQQFGMVVTLVLLIICLNAIAIFFRAKMYRKLRGH